MNISTETLAKMLKRKPENVHKTILGFISNDTTGIFNDLPPDPKGFTEAQAVALCACFKPLSVHSVRYHFKRLRLVHLNTLITQLSDDHLLTLGIVLQAPPVLVQGYLAEGSQGEVAYRGNKRDIDKAMSNEITKRGLTMGYLSRMKGSEGSITC